MADYKLDIRFTTYGRSVESPDVKAKELAEHVHQTLALTGVSPNYELTRWNKETGKWEYVTS